MIDISEKLQERYGKDYLSYSSIKNALVDMALFDKYMKGEIKYESEALQFGTLYDDMLFDPNFSENYIIIDEESIISELSPKAQASARPKQTKEYKEAVNSAWAEAIDEGKQVVASSDYRKSKDMVNRLKQCGLYGSHLSGDYQVEFKKELDTSIGPVKFRGFLDCLGDGFISDSKSSMSVSKFRYSVRDFGYDIQAYLYTKAFNIDKFYWVVQEKKEPYLPALVECSEESLFAGEMKVNEALESIKTFLQYGKEPSKNFVSFKV